MTARRNEWRVGRVYARPAVQTIRAGTDSLDRPLRCCSTQLEAGVAPSREQTAAEKLVFGDSLLLLIRVLHNNEQCAQPWHGPVAKCHRQGPSPYEIRDGSQRVAA